MAEWLRVFHFIVLQSRFWWKTLLPLFHLKKSEMSSKSVSKMQLLWITHGSPNMPRLKVKSQNWNEINITQLLKKFLKCYLPNELKYTISPCFHVIFLHWSLDMIIIFMALLMSFAVIQKLLHITMYAIFFMLRKERWKKLLHSIFFFHFWFSINYN